LLAGSYFLAAVPFGYLIGRLYGVDVRRQGSGNIGAANILRTVGKIPAVLTLLLDAGKGFLPVFLARKFLGLDPAWAVAAGLTAVFGHTFSCFLKFKGGKGVATSFGVLTGLSPLAALCVLVIWLVCFSATRIVSFSSLAAAFCLPFLLWFLAGRQKTYLVFGCLAAGLVFFAHRRNIRRLLSGAEPKIGAKK